jgi:adenylosuccinate synthase
MKSKDLFSLMRQQEIETQNFLPNRLEIQLSAKTFIKEVLDAGEIDKIELLAQAKRMGEALDVINAELIKVLPQENFEAFGLKGTFRSGGETINYKDCEVWSDINRELKEREDLLKLALKSQNEIYDAAGVQVPKVSTTPRKSSLAISF